MDSDGGVIHRSRPFGRRNRYHVIVVRNREGREVYLTFDLETPVKFGGHASCIRQETSMKAAMKGLRSPRPAEIAEILRPTP